MAAASNSDNYRSHLTPLTDTNLTAPARDQQWMALRALHYYRLIVLILLLLIFLVDEGRRLITVGRPELFITVLLAYLGIVIMALPASVAQRPALQTQALSLGLVDIVALILLAAAAGGAGSDILLLLLVTVAGNGVLLPLRALLTLAVSAAGAMLTLWLWTSATAPNLQLLDDDGPLQILFAMIYQFGSTLSRIAALAASALLAGLGTYALAERTRRSERLAAQRAQALRELDQLNQAIIQQLQFGILVIDPRDRVLLMNDAARAILDSLDPRPEPALTQLSQPLASQLRAWRRGRPDNRPFRPADHLPEIAARFSALGDDPRQANVLIALEDYSEVEQQLQHLKLAALGRMSASIAHELRNPLSAIGHAAQLLQETSANPRLAEIIHGNTRRANRIIGDVLDLARRAPSRPEDIALRDWLEHWRSEFLMACGQPQPQIELTVEPEELTVWFDPAQLRQVLDNLAGNARRYGVADGESTARIRVIAQWHEATQCPVLDIQDAGPGVPEAEQHKLFEPFHTTGSQGTGLGLYIARELCEANRGRLQYLPSPDGGRFRISFAATVALQRVSNL